MGQKVHPKGFRLGITKTWDSISCPKTKAEYRNQVIEDHRIREFIYNFFSRPKERNYALISRIEIHRMGNRANVRIFTARPGVVIGRKGSEVERLRRELSKRFPDKEIWIEVKEVEHPDLDAAVVAENIVKQLERRISYRRAMNVAAQRVIRAGAQGVKIEVKGRLDGAELARRERVLIGRVPLQTLMSDIDYHLSEALTKYGKIGVKVWIYKGIIAKDEETKKQFDLLMKLSAPSMMDMGG